MVNAIKDLLQNLYPAMSWVIFGDDELPTSPYGVLKTEKSINGRGLRVILHRNKGERSLLEVDFKAVTSLLNECTFQTSTGEYNMLGRLLDYTDVAPQSDDGTISMEALYLMPTKTF